MPYLLDENFNQKVARAISEEYEKVFHTVGELGLRGESDEKVLKKATERGLTLVSFDRHFSSESRPPTDFPYGSLWFDQPVTRKKTLQLTKRFLLTVANSPEDCDFHNKIVEIRRFAT